MLDILDNILSVPQRVLDLVRGAKDLRRDDAERAAALFDAIGQALAAAAAEVRLGNVPHGICGQLLTFSDMFVDATRGVLDRDRGVELANVLRSNYEVERLAGELADAQDREPAAAKLEESSGRFIALAHVVRAKS